MTMTTTKADVISSLEGLLSWSKPLEKETVRGPRILRTATPTEAFWNAWRAGKDQLRALGVSVGKVWGGNDWEVKWWTEIDPAWKAAREAAVEDSRATDADVEIPAPGGLAYMPFQRAGIQYASGRTGTLIADEMGLGKTIQAIGFVNCHPEVKKVLVITKASLKANWWRELRKWLVDPDLANDVGIASGSCFPRSAVLVANYDIAAKYKDRLAAGNWDVVILDEAHQVKNRKAKRTVAIVGYKPRKDEPAELASSGIPARYKIALTGTPIENRLEEMWTVLRWLQPENFPSVWKLKKLAEVRYTPGVGEGAATSRGLDALQTYLRRTVMVRRLKSEVLTELPPKTRSVVEFDADGMENLVRAEQDLWKKSEDERVEAKADVEIARASGDEEAYKAAVEKLRSKMRIAFEEMARVRRETAVAKIPKTITHLRDMLDEVGKVIVFAHHTECLEQFAREFGSSAVMVHGGTPLDVRDQNVHRFQTDPECRLFLGSIRATGEGLTLTAATHVVFHEFDWVPSKMVQCEDRAHRIGQKDNVTVEVCVVDGTIDARMAQICVAKANLAKAALDDRSVRKDEASGSDERSEWSALRTEPPVDGVEWKPLGSDRELAAEAVAITEERLGAIVSGLQMLAGMCDGARTWDGSGFNKMDSAIGKKLAVLGRAMTPRQAALGAKLVNRYRRQLPEAVVVAATGKTEAAAGE